MKPGEVRVLIDKYETLAKKRDQSLEAVKLSKESDVKMVLTIGMKKGSNKYFPLEFNLELGQALYQAKLDQNMEELEEIKRRIDLWT